MKQKAKKVTVSKDKLAMFLFILFLLVVIFFFDAANNTYQKVTSEKMMSKLVITGNEDNGVAFVVEDKVDAARLMEFANKDYEQLKKELGINGDFTVYFEDEQGNLVPIGNKYCIGSDRASVSGFTCR